MKQVLHDPRDRSTISYDANARPLLMGRAADVRGRVGKLVAGSDLVKVSDTDAAWLSPDESAKERATRWLASVLRSSSSPAGPPARWACAGPAASRCQRRAWTSTSRWAPVTARWMPCSKGCGCTTSSAGRPGPALASVIEQVLETVVCHAARAAAITVSRPGAAPRPGPGSTDRPPAGA